MAVFLVVTAILTIILSYYLNVWIYWKRRGIPGPMGYPILGNVLDFFNHEKPLFMVLREYTKKYGSYFGITEGPTKTLVISDLDMINEVFVKQFDNFYGRKLHNLHGDPEEDERVNLFISRGYRWKRLRNLSSPTFSNNNLKKLKETVEDSALELLRHIEKNTKNDQQIDMLTYYQEFTLDVIGRIAMGQHESKMFENPLIEHVKAIFGPGRRSLFTILSVLPRPIARKIREYVVLKSSNDSNPAVVMNNVIQKAVENRMKQRESVAKQGIENGEPADFIDLFLDAQSDIDIKSEASDNFTKSNIKVNRSLTFEEVIAQCFVFIIAGFDTTALSLSFSTYLLATNPQIMRKAQQEIEEQCPDPSISFDQISKLKYLDYIVKETLRLYPLAALANSRKCMRSTKIGSVEIEKGTNVLVDTWTLHYSKQVWGEDADVFRPERWAEQGVSDFMSGYLPFGMGPRQCIGMRLAYMEEKLLLAHILRKYDFVTGSKTQIPMRLVGRATTQPQHVFLHLKPRF